MTAINRLPESYKKVFLHIAKNKPQIKYEIEKTSKINRAIVYPAVKELVKIGAIEGKEIGTSRAGLPITQYKLTLLGLCIALSIANGEDYREISHNWGYLEPTILDRWTYFEMKLGKEEAASFFRGVNADTAVVKENEKFGQGLIQDIFSYYEKEMFRVRTEIVEKYRQGWLSDLQRELRLWIKAFRDDPELKELAASALKRKLDRISEEKRFVSELMQGIMEDTA